MKKYFKWIVCMCLIAVFIMLGFLVLNRKEILIDSVIYNFISKFISTDLTNVIKYLTHLASVFIVVLITILILIFHKDKKYGIVMAIDLIIITILQFVLKFSFMRNRPVDINLIEETGYSFPSGHSLTAMAFYGLIIWFIYKSNFPKQSKIIYISLFSFIIFLVGISRIYLGVHFFTDVLGAFCFSSAFLIIYTSVIEKIIYKK